MGVVENQGSRTDTPPSPPPPFRYGGRVNGGGDGGGGVGKEAAGRIYRAVP